jgi:cytochrome P450/NADPH-cytochrome P450 reductase
VLEFVEPAHDPLLRLNHMQRGLVVENRELVRGAESFGRSRHHIEIALPDGCSYRPGDYLVVLPENPAEDVGRALRRFGLPYDAQVVLRPSPGLQTLFPVGKPVMTGELLRSYVELAMPATRRVVAQLAASATDPADAEALAALMATDAVYTNEVLEKRLSMLDLLERFGSCDLSFAGFLHALPSLKPRQYSVSSSPRWSATHCTITVGVVNAPAWSGQGTHHGVASNFLALARPGTQIAVDTRPSHDGFHLPNDTATPIIMIAAGTGIAPFRGFLQDRAIRAAHGEALGAAHLFFGCHHCDVDFLYADELQQWEQDSVVRVHCAFHKPTDGEAQYVQDRLWADRAIVMRLMDDGARIYVCGDGHTMADAVRTTLGRMYQELNGGTSAMVDAWLVELETGFRYSQDVFT